MNPPTQPAVDLASRRKHLDAMQQDILDVLILGGGINGAGIARDLSMRARQAGKRLRIGLVEQHHFASAASGKNSQLIHGGLRYLKMGEFGLVHESLRERATLLQIAPHLVEPLPFLIPFYGRRARWYYSFGLWLYDHLAGRSAAGGKNPLPGRRAVSLEELERLEPGLRTRDLVSGAIYYDCHVHSARLVLENIFDAVARGVYAANYTRADQFTDWSGGYRVALTDTLSGATFEVRARKLVDTTGPWQRVGRLRLVRGSHIVVPRFTKSENAIADFTDDGRLVFVIPWRSRDDLCVVGTTDVDHVEGADHVRISWEEVNYLRGVVGKLFPASRDVEPIAAFSSLRPLLRTTSDSATKTSREHRIWWGESGRILHVAGGKYTTYRAMSEEAVNLLAEDFAPELAELCATASVPVTGNSRVRLEQLRRAIPHMASQHEVEEEDIRRLLHDYGAATPAVLDLLPASGPAGASRIDAARITYAVHHEMARRLSDFLYVSTQLGYERRWKEEELRPYARVMGELLNWDEQWMEREVREALEVSRVGE